MYAITNQKNAVSMAMTGTKLNVLDEHEGWLVATTPMRKPGVSSLPGTPLDAAARGEIGGFGSPVSRVLQSRCPPPQKRHGPIFESHTRSSKGLPSTRDDVSLLVVMAETVAASLETVAASSAVAEDSM
jgi:hypothetical protein